MWQPNGPAWTVKVCFPSSLMSREVSDFRGGGLYSRCHLGTRLMSTLTWLPRLLGARYCSWAELGGLLGGYYGQALEVAYCPPHTVSCSSVAWLPLNARLRNVHPGRRGNWMLLGQPFSLLQSWRVASAPRYTRDGMDFIKIILRSEIPGRLRLLN